jgi:hypothetical protein
MQNASRNIMKATHVGSKLGSHSFKEALDGDEEESCQEKEEKVVLLRSQVSVQQSIKGK